METALYIACSLCVLIVCSQFFHQWKMKRDAYLMREAIRNKDYSFKLSAKGMWSGEREMIETLNNMGREMKSLMAENEVESWQKLTRVLTHEIMNATAPINSISQALLKRSDVKGTALEEGIKAIHDTGAGLSHFVESYRKFTQLQKPQPSEVRIKPFIEGIVPMYSEIRWEIDIDDETTVNIDEGLVRQIIINLTKNAIEAGAKKMGVKITGKEVSKSNNICMAISNDGAPIPAEVREDIFTPFFTTKKSGNGIGLSLSRQMIVMQGGDLRLRERSELGWKVTFDMQMVRGGVH